jgi:ATP-dependent DNA helicase RecG
MSDLDAAAGHVQRLLDNGRSSGLHWFPDDVSRSALAETLVALANSGGGQILLGVSPRSPQVQGIRDLESSLDKVFQAALECDPTLVLPVPKTVSIQGRNVLWVLVPPGLPNVYSVGGRYLGRDGVQNTPLSARKLRRLLVERGILPFETRLVEEASLQDLDQAQVDNYLHALDLSVSEPEEELLVRRGCLHHEKSGYVPTYAGLLLFGKNPQRWLPNASLMAVRFQSETLGDRFIKKEISGTLPDQIRQASQFLIDQLGRVVQIRGLEHQEVLQYPFEAVRELLVNAVAHRDYNLQGDNIHLNIFSNRLEIHSPGGLPGPVNLDNLLQARFSRNPVIMQVLSDLGFGERIGYGLDRVVAVMRENNLPHPKFEEIAGSFRVTLLQREPAPSARVQLKYIENLELNSRQQAVVAYLVQRKRVTNREYQDLCPEVHPETLRRDLADLVQRGVLIKIGDKRATYYVLKRNPEQLPS